MAPQLIEKIDVGMYLLQKPLFSRETYHGPRKNRECFRSFASLSVSVVIIVIYIYTLPIYFHLAYLFASSFFPPYKKEDTIFDRTIRTKLTTRFANRWKHETFFENF